MQHGTTYPLPTDAPRAHRTAFRRPEGEWGVWAGVLEEEWKEEVPPQMAVSGRRSMMDVREDKTLKSVGCYFTGHETPALACIASSGSEAVRPFCQTACARWLRPIL